MNCAGESARLTYSLSYSAPEVLCALNSGAEHVVAESALDVWAVGVIAYELMIDRPCLLYTSPSPRDATLSRMPSSA